jgi:hypothetical protein
MAGHHLVLGEIVDFIKGERLKDTHDERHRQKIARILVDEKGFQKQEIEPRKKLLVTAGDKRATVKIDFLIKLLDRICMIIKYGPGSMVTRRRSALAASRLVAPYQVPVAVVTNGEDADILDGLTGEVVFEGLGNIPSKSQLLKRIGNQLFSRIPDDRAEMEARILYFYEVDGSCPCDENICRL